jgi:hypothetical protein
MLACDKVKLLEAEFKQKHDSFTVMLSVINAQKIEGSQRWELRKKTELERLGLGLRDKENSSKHTGTFTGSNRG